MKNSFFFFFAPLVFLLLSLSSSCVKDKMPALTRAELCRDSLSGIWSSGYAYASDASHLFIAIVPGSLVFDLKMDGTGKLQLWGETHHLKSWNTTDDCSGFDFTDALGQPGHFDIKQRTATTLSIEGDMLLRHFYADLYRQ